MSPRRNRAPGPKLDPIHPQCLVGVPVPPLSPATRSAGLPVDSHQRKQTPVFSGVLAYFPDALAEVAALSLAGNDKHNPGEPLHWSKDKSSDEDDCLIRHALNVAKGEVFDSSYPGRAIRHRAAMAWRALAGLQRELEAEASVVPPHS